ncbi:MAG: hypothetical protein PHD00_05765 [Bacteroidales bacterium]|jgi:hypothetical protein|nr:hypothetical protein [Bacteroidales bacterium]MDD4671876.1 hypothetical protein [Bacteroidales bacterium]MDY0349160.1 hypothetical protein [Tenuifilaceae bacterium]
MKTSNTFSAKRIGLLMYRHVFYNVKTYLLSFAAAGSILIIISLLSTIGNDYLAKGLFITLGQVFLFIGGVMLTSNVFKEISSKHRGWLYMILPANPSEKILSYWLLTTAGFAVMASLTMVASSIVLSVLSTLIFKTAFYVFNPFSVAYLEILLHYCIVQSLFFFGAIFFQKNNFIKTILSVFVFNTILGIIAVIITYLVFGKAGINSNNIQLTDDHFFSVIIPYIAKISYYGLMVPFFVTVSYFKLKEREV